jgi:hypothetical protein
LSTGWAASRIFFFKCFFKVHPIEVGKYPYPGKTVGYLFLETLKLGREIPGSNILEAV